MRKVSDYKKRSLWLDVWNRLRRNVSAVIGIVVFLAILLVCVLSPLYLNYEVDVLGIDTSIKRMGPSLEHILGTDELGRDMLARLIWGGRTTLLLSLGALAFGFVIGAVLGTVAGYYGRLTDTLIMRFIDIVMAVPTVLLMIALATVMNTSTVSLIFIVGAGLVPGMARVIRGQVMQISECEYIEATRVQGASDFKIILKHIMPNAISPIITTIIMDVSFAVLLISTLSFLGLGVQPPEPEWGTMLAGGRDYLRDSWHIATWPGVALTITLIALTLVGDGLRDAMDPRMKR